jgi:hypothetical protein
MVSMLSAAAIHGPTEHSTKGHGGAILVRTSDAPCDRSYRSCK